MAAAKAKMIAGLAKFLGVPVAKIGAAVGGLGLAVAKPKAKGKAKAKGKGGGPKGGAVPPAVPPGVVPGGLAGALGFGGLAPLPMAGMPALLGLPGAPPPMAPMPLPPAKAGRGRGGKAPGAPPVAPPALPPMGFPAIPPGAMPGMPGVSAGGAPGTGQKLHSDMWVSALQSPHLVQSSMDAGDLLELVTLDPTTRAVNGTWIFEVTKAHPTDAVGRYLEGVSRCCSVATYAPGLLLIFPSGGQGTGLVHLCLAGMAACAGQAPGRQVVHVEQFRLRSAATINEVWFVKDAREKRDKVQELRDKLLAQRVKSGAATVEEQVAFNLAQKLKAQYSKRKKHKGKKKKGGSSSDSDDAQPAKKKPKKKKADSDDSDSASSLFSGPLPLEGSQNAIALQALRKPGSLYTDASMAAASATGARGRGTKETAAYAMTGDQGMAYLQTVLAPRFPQGIPDTMKKELNTLAISLGHLARGEISEMSDVLVQRLKSPELGLDGNEPAALAVQLVDLHRNGLTSRNELEAAQQHQRRELKLAEQQRRLG